MALLVTFREMSLTPLQVMQSTDHGSVGQDAETVEQLNESGDLRQLLRPFQVSVCHALVMQSCTVSCSHVQSWPQCWALDTVTWYVTSGQRKVHWDLRSVISRDDILYNHDDHPSLLYTTIRNLPCWLSVMLWSRLKAPPCLLFSCSPVNQDVIPRSKILLGRLENSCCLFHAMGNNLRSLQTVGLIYIYLFFTPRFRI